MSSQHMSNRGCWVYGVTDAEPDLSGVAGVAGEPVRAVPAGSLTALVSDVDLDEFGAEPLARNLEDLDWLEAVARAHHEVIEAASGRLPVLPVGLTTVYSSEAGLAEAFGAREAEFLDGLALVRDRVEWGVKAYARPQEPRSKPARPKPGGTDGKGSGLDYLKRRRAELDTQRESRRDAAEAARDAHAALADQAILFRLHPPQSPQLSGSDAPMLLNAAYLVDRAEESGFADAVAAVADTHPELRVELTGPWPPYSFAGQDREDTREPEEARP